MGASHRPGTQERVERTEAVDVEGTSVHVFRHAGVVSVPLRDLLLASKLAGGKLCNESSAIARVNVNTDLRPSP